MIWNLVELVWRPILEIGILSVGIYWIIRFVWRTRGWSVVAGFLALAAIWAFTRLLDLSVLSAILGSFFSFAPFAVLILFHQEIRRMLSSLGSFSSVYSTREQRENLENVIQAADLLSSAKIRGPDRHRDVDLPGGHRRFRGQGGLRGDIGDAGGPSSSPTTPSTTGG